MQEYYSKTFFEDHTQKTLLSSREIVPLVLNLAPSRSVVDVGCGIGEWLSVFREQGVSDILGIDGNWVDKKMLMIPLENFQTADLTKPLEVGKKFDLVVSLEVGEHLDKNCSEIYVDSLTKLGSVILFSAAIPFQSGKHHVNEQWPEYWSKLFQKREYVVIDCLRRIVWQNENVEFWYAQNIFLYVKKDVLLKNEGINKAYLNTNQSMLSIVHPKMFLHSNKIFSQEIRNYELLKKAFFPIWWVRKILKNGFL